MSNQDERLCSDFHRLLEGVSKPCSFEYPPTAPLWLDEDLFMAGIKFYHDNMVGILASNGEALIMGLCIPSFYKALAFTGVTTQNRCQALRRYGRTGKHIGGSWYRGMPWKDGSPAAVSIKTVNMIHKKVRDSILNSETDLDSVVDKRLSNIEVSGENQAKILQVDLNEIKESYKISPEYYTYIKSEQPFSQFDMTLVQAAFFAPTFLYPERYGLKMTKSHGESGFLHVWRVFGYYLSISDENNAPGFGEDRGILVGRQILEEILKPCMLNLSLHSMLMAQMLFSDPSLYYVRLYINYKMVGFDLKRLWQSFNWRQRYIYYWRTFFFEYLYPLRFVKVLMNKFANYILNKVWKS